MGPTVRGEEHPEHPLGRDQGHPKDRPHPLGSTADVASLSCRNAPMPNAAVHCGVRVCTTLLASLMPAGTRRPSMLVEMAPRSARELLVGGGVVVRQVRQVLARQFVCAGDQLLQETPRSRTLQQFD